MSGLTDRDDNVIGIALKYVGSPSGDYFLMHLYCNRNDLELDWNGEFIMHRDGGENYYQVTMSTITGCSVIVTDQFWFFLNKVKLLFAFVGLLGGLIVMLAGRLLIKYV